MLSLLVFLRLPFQTVSHEQILSTETVLESGQTWRQQHHRHSSPHQTPRTGPPHLYSSAL